MSDSIDARLQRLLGGDRLASLRKRLRQRFERAPFDDVIERMHIGGLTAGEHAALAALLGRPQRPARSLHVDVRLVDAALQRAGIAPSLRNALEQLDGPIVHLVTERHRLEALWSDVTNGCQHPGLVALLQMPAGVGLLKRLAGGQSPVAAQLCRRAEAVLQRLPANAIPRSQLAADVLGDAHALDNGQGTASLVLAVWRRVVSPARDEDGEVGGEPAEGAAGSVDGGVAPPDGDGAQQPGGEERVRAVWARAGVLVNELARPALFLNLPTRDARRYGQALGEPTYASLRSLLRSPPAWDVAGRQVYVCENPNFLAIAADHWGPRCAPLVCTDGMPAAAQRCLLSQLVHAGARLCYHGDFDWPGLRIGNHVMREHGARPWRFGAADYLAAVQMASGLGQPLAGNAVEALWDATLATTMQEHRISVAEEALAVSLLQDLDDR